MRETMKIQTTILAAAMAFLPVSSRADDAAPDKAKSLQTWFTHWQQAIKRSAVESRYKKVRTTSVAAVRGAGQSGDDPKKPYWKGSWSAKRAGERNAERVELEKAVEAILKGDIAAGQAALEAFEKAHPASSLLADVREAKGQLAELKAAKEPKPVEAAKPVEAPKPAEAPAPAVEAAAASPAAAP